MDVSTCSDVDSPLKISGRPVNVVCRVLGLGQSWSMNGTGRSSLTNVASSVSDASMS
jgi:hypothetical protein